MSNSDMSMQVLSVHESFSAVLARERILLGVFGDLVVFEVLFPIEALAALGALVQRMIDVFRLVLFEFVLARKRHITMVAFKRTYVAVARQRMPFQMKRSLERHAAVLARLVLAVVVQSSVSRQVFARFKRISAQIAHKQAQIVRVVRCQVIVERVARRKLFIACRAVEFGFQFRAE